ncbi:MAG: acyl-CoA dehydratase activase [Desulfobulbus sp.]|jgi:predicted CoA-substrate-specific enzyme activase
MIHIGLDLGSTAIKAVMIDTNDGDRIIAQRKRATAPGQEQLATAMISEMLSEEKIAAEDVSAVAATGYGKNLYSEATITLDEIRANALGIHRLSGGRAKTIVNIGGQDLKVIELDEVGGIRDFRMNDKCAAGTGRFFELVARILDIPLENFSDLLDEHDQDLELSSTCVVFAETEIVSLLARGVSPANIIGALYSSVARRVAGLMGRGFGSGPIYLDGGPAQHQGLLMALEDELMTDVHVLAEPQFTVAYGAAISIGLE